MLNYSTIRYGFISLVATLGTANVSEADDVTDSDVAAIADAVKSAPPWIHPNSPKYRTAVADYKSLAEQFRKLPPDQARRVVRQLVNQVKGITEDEADLEMMSRLYVLMRCYFNVPSDCPKEKTKFFGGWLGVPESERGFNILWPLAETPDGTVTLSGRFSGYKGPPYDAIGEFDFFNSEFGVRKR